MKVRIRKFSALMLAAVYLACSFSAPIFAESNPAVSALVTNNPFSQANQLIRGDAIGIGAGSTYLLTRNQFGDHWKIVIDSKNQLSLVNDHEQLNGETRRYYFAQGSSKKDAYFWPISVKINPADTKIVIQNQENRRTIYFNSKTVKVMFRSDFSGRKIIMAVRQLQDDQKWTLRKVLFDFDPFRGRGKMTVGTLKGSEGKQQFSSTMEYQVLGTGIGYQLKKIGAQIKK